MSILGHRRRRNAAEEAASAAAELMHRVRRWRQAEAQVRQQSGTGGGGTRDTHRGGDECLTQA